MPRLVLNKVSCLYKQTVAVDAVSLALEPGEFVSLLGPSGCGKTTTLRMIAGFVAPTSGTIELDGKILSSARACVPPEKRGMSMIFQSYAIWPHMTVAENVAFGLELRKLSKAETQQRVAAALDLVRLSALGHRYPAELSGGQQQRVALARAVVVRPSVLLLDEPLSNLDANLREEMRFEIRRLHDEFHITTVYVTHDQAEAMVTSDRIAVMNCGRIEQFDDPQTLYMQPRTRFVASFVGRTNFIEGMRRGAEIVFDYFAIDTTHFPAVPQGTPVTFALRPQNLEILQALPAETDARCRFEATIVERAFLGESWDYIVRPNNGPHGLRISASPHQVLAVDAPVWVAFDPRRMSFLTPEPTAGSEPGGAVTTA